jgi:glucose 1-dehydrogenase
MKLLGRKALVTGSGVRLGRAIAQGLAEAGCDVALQYRRSAEGVAATAAAIAGVGRRGVVLQADLRDAAACRTLVETARAELGGLDILVNSAALFLPGDLATTTLEAWDTQLALNLRAPFFLCQAFAAGVGGKIVNVTDSRARRAGRGHLAYRLSKVALNHLTELLALELAPRFTVNAVAPGAMLAAAGDDDRALEARVDAAVPLRRAGGAQPVVDAVLYLLGEDFVTGVVLPVDGGEYL